MIDWGADYGIDMDARDEQVARAERNRIVELLEDYQHTLYCITERDDDPFLKIQWAQAVESCVDIINVDMLSRETDD
jgi:hypothetical protein